MKSKALIISLLACIAIGYQSCDSRLNVDNKDDFYKYIGGDGNQWGIDLVTDSNGNIFILGKTDSNSDGMQIYVVMTDPKGNVQWTNTFGDPGDEDPKDLELLSDGNLVLVADRTEIGTGEKDFMIYTVSSADGSIIGTPVKVADSEKGVPDHVNSITETTDGFITASYSEKNGFKEGFVFRYDKKFVMFPDSWTAGLSQKQDASGHDVVPVKVIQFDANNFYTFGYTSTFNGDSFDDNNFFIYAGNDLNDGGKLLIIAGPDVNSDERLTSVRAINREAGSGYVLTGYISYPASGQQDLYVLKTPLLLYLAKDTDSTTYVSGTPKVVTTGLSTITPSTASVFSSAGSGFLLLAEENLSGNGNIYLTKVDRNLTDAWPGQTSHLFGGVGNDLAGAVVETSNERILVLGTMIVGEINGQSKIVLMNLSPNGMFGQ